MGNRGGRWRRETYHKYLALKNIPDGDWYCPGCSNARNEDKNNNSLPVISTTTTTTESSMQTLADSSVHKKEIKSGVTHHMEVIIGVTSSFVIEYVPNGKQVEEENWEMYRGQVDLINCPLRDLEFYQNDLN